MKTTAPFGKPGTPDVASIERAIKVAIGALEQMGVRRECCVAVGGGFLGEGSALAVGADAYWPDTSVATKSGPLAT